MIRLEKTALELRRKIIKIAYLGGTGHIASSLSSLDILIALYLGDIITCDIKYPNRDRFILSKGHATLALYNVLCKMNFFTWKELKTYCKPGTVFGGEPMPLVPGVECATGALGHGLSFGVGVALSARLNNLSYRTYVLTGDGECQEGSIWEAAMSIIQYNLTNLIWIIDSNKIQATGRISDILQVEPLETKLRSFGFEIASIDGHNYDDLLNIFCMTKKKMQMPMVIIANTLKGKGLSLFENKDDCHYKVPDEEEYKSVVNELGLKWEEFKDL